MRNIAKKIQSFENLSQTCAILLLIPKTHWESVALLAAELHQAFGLKTVSAVGPRCLT